MKDSTTHTFVYAIVLGVVCASFLTGAGRFTAPYREANERAEKVSNILGVLGIEVAPNASADDLLALFDSKVQTREDTSITMYMYRGNDGSLQATAVPFSGPGVWGPMEGILSLEPDMRTIRGISFYKQEETPGLGGEIGTPQFQDQFKGKSIESDAGSPGIHVRLGASGQNEVDAITGATMTCDKVEDMLNAVIAKIVKERTNNE